MSAVAGVPGPSVSAGFRRALHVSARVPRWCVAGVLRLYRVIVSPLYGQTCRFYPSCSAYALEAVETHGVVRGGWLAGSRLLRCHPWNPGGVDPVPPVRGTCPDVDRGDVAASMHDHPSHRRAA